MAARSKAWGLRPPFTGIAGSKPPGGMDILFLVTVMCCPVEVSAKDDHSSRAVLPSEV